MSINRVQWDEQFVLEMPPIWVCGYCSTGNLIFDHKKFKSYETTESEMAHIFTANLKSTIYYFCKPWNKNGR